MPKIVASHRNSEGEKITIEMADNPPFEGQRLLVLHDDPPPSGTGVSAPMLLDEGTRQWLLTQLQE